MINAAFENLLQYVEKEEFKGYDPYDTLNSSIPFSVLGKWGPIFAIQFQKRNPFNIRPLIGIKKEINPKAFGLFLEAYSKLYVHTKNENYKEKADYFFNWLITNYTKGYAGMCWGYNFDWASPVKYLKAHSPTIVVSGFIAKGIYQYWKATKNPQAIDALKSIANFAENDLEKTTTNYGTCISYSTEMKDCCYNASMLAGELYAMLYDVTKDLKTKAIQIANFTIHHQQSNGSWNYSLHIKTGKERTQIDFHQGYILDSLYTIQKLCDLDESKYYHAIKAGLKYYKNEQFLASGQSLWRVPKKWPTEIHNQSQGIITMSKLDKKDNFAFKIATWTIKNMQAQDGHFYYKKYPFYNIKTPYMRWAQAWMFLALTHLITKEN